MRTPDESLTYILSILDKTLLSYGQEPFRWNKEFNRLIFGSIRYPTIESVILEEGGVASVMSGLPENGVTDLLTIYMLLYPRLSKEEWGELIRALAISGAVYQPEDRRSQAQKLLTELYTKSPQYLVIRLLVQMVPFSKELYTALTGARPHG
jgi:hypothetical protein